VVGALLTFAGLWGVPWLAAAYGLSTAEAAGVASLLLVAWALGGPAFGALSDRLGRRKPLYVAGVATVALAWAMVFYGSPSRGLLVPLLLVAGFGSGCMAPGFAFAKESVPPPLAGTVSGLVNTGVMVAPMVLQPSVGWVLDRLWSGTMQGGVRVYELSSYRAGFGLVMAWLVASLVLIPFARETGCRQQGSAPRAPGAG
jgi:MFS family permease